MKFETLKSFNKKKVIIPTVIISCLIIVITIFVSHSKYVYKDSITIMDDEVNYKPYDFKIIGIYQQIDSCVGYNCYEEKEVMPSEGYEINQEKSYCYVDDENQKITGKVYTNEDGEVVIKELSKRSKCYLYFDKVKTASEKTLDELAKLTPELTNQGVIDKEGIWGTSCKNGTNGTNKNQAGIQGNCDVEENGIYETEDNDGTSYYFRGTVENNYVKFGKDKDQKDIWWRIIRINGDGSIRMIYAGTGSDVPDQRSDATNIIVDGENTFYYATEDRKYDNNMYVGYQYTSGVRNGHATDSYAKTIVETWFEQNLLDEFNDGVNTKIDTNAGYCVDRQAYSDSKMTHLANETHGINTQATYYGSRKRNYPNDNYAGVGNPAHPSYICSDATNDLLTYKESNKGTQSLKYPIGLIIADEVVYAGGLYGQRNSNYYLYNNTYYRVMSPSAFFGGFAWIFIIFDSGNLGQYGADSKFGFRPVLNLKSNSIISGTGMSSNPFKTEL